MASERPPAGLDQSARQHFLIADSELCYLDGNSLGRLPHAASERLRQLVEVGWGSDLIGGWNRDWIDLPERIGDKLARLVGAAAGEVVVSDSTSVNLFKLATAALRHQAGRRRVVTDAANFPSDLYMLQSAGEASGRDIELVSVGDPHAVLLEEDDIMAAIDADTALVSLSLVTFRSGQWYDLEKITRRAHQCGALVLWDLSHAVGAVPIDLAAAGADLAVGCCYKYLCGGPGAPAFLYVREDLQSQLENPLSGWFSHAQPFAFAPEYRPASDVKRFLTGTPYVLSLAAIEAGVDLVAASGIEVLRARSVELSERFLEHFDARLEPLGFTLRSPRQAARRGSHISLGHPEARRITANLIERHRVIPDFRTPDNLRLGFAPLYTTADEVDRAAEAIRTTVAERQYEAVILDDAPVT